MKVYEVKNNYKWFRFYVNILLIIQAIFITINTYNEVFNFKYIFEEIDWYDTFFVIKVFLILILEIFQVTFFINQLVKTKNKNSKAVKSILLVLWYTLISDIIIYFFAYEEEELIGRIIGTATYIIPNIVYFYHRLDGFEDYKNEEEKDMIESNNLNNTNTATDNKEQVILDEKSELIDKASISSQQKIELIKNKNDLTLEEIKEKLLDIEESSFNFCPNCGKKIEDGWKFCKYCGHKIE